jgi:Flp pilus assembly protein TadB
VSKERKLRRAEREAEQERLLAAAARKDARRLARRERWRKISLYELRQRRSGRLARHSNGERALLLTLVAFGLVLIWLLAPHLALRIALTLLLLLLVPVFSVLAFDRRSS